MDGSFGSWKGSCPKDVKLCQNTSAQGIVKGLKAWQPQSNKRNFSASLKTSEDLPLMYNISNHALCKC